MGMVLRLATLAVIARYLTQAELGLVSMLLAIIFTMQAFGDFGLSAVIVQRTSLTREQLSSLFWLAQLTGLACLLLVVLFEPAIVALYGDPRLQGLIGWLALRFLLTPLGIPFYAMLQRDLQFRRAFWIATGASALGSAVTMVGAIRGHGISALIAGELTTATTYAVLALILGWKSWRPAMRLRREDLREPLRFSLFQVGERVFNLFATNIDYILVGRVLGAEALGIYALAFELVSTPARLNGVLMRVAFPMLAKKQDDADGFRRGVLDLVRLIALVQLPVLAAIALLAPFLVPVFLGPKWGDVVPLVQILSVFGAIRVLGNPSGPAFLAKGHPQIGFYFNVAVAAVVIVAFSLTVSSGLEAIAWTWVAVIGVQLVALTIILNRLTGLTWRMWGHALGRPLAIVGLAIAYLAAARAIATEVTTSLDLQLIVALALAMPLFAITAWRLERAFLSLTFALLRRQPTPPAI